MFYPERCVGCGRRSSDVLCRACFEALPRVGSPVCGRCGLPTAFATFVCEACKNVDFGFESARAPLRYEGVGKEVVHALKYRGYKKVVARLATPLMLQALGDGRFDAVVPVPLHRSRLRKRGFNQAELLGAGRRRRDKRTRIGYTRSRAQHKGPGRALCGPEAGQRRGRLQGGRASPGPSTPDRRRLHHRRHHERLRLDPAPRRRRGSPRVEPV